ncbi:MAG TPA: hypothetical protein VH186_06270 [Chloroflexia bacterium]|nr:hypothetical protein [Chloroflexia bacterium]
MATTVKTFTSNGTWICPPGVTTCNAEVWAGGGGGAGRTTNGSGGGGGGGAYSRNNCTVTAGTSYNVVVGAGGAAGSGATPGHGGNSSFGSLVVAEGGRGVANNTTTGGAGGANANGTGDYKKSGGLGNTGGTPNANNGGGGGSAGGNNGDGLPGSGNTGGGNGSGTLPGGAGAGGNGAKTGSAVGTAGSQPGGGGGGATRNSSTSRAGAAGAQGKVVVTYTTPLASALTENFNTNSLDTTKWGSFGFTSGSVSVAGRVLKLSVAATTLNSESGICSLEPYDFTGVRLSARVVQAPTGHAYADFGIQLEYQTLESSDHNWAFISVDASTQRMQAVKKVADAFTMLADTPYDPFTMLYWAVRESGGTIYWEYSADGTNWTTLYSEASPFAVTSAYFLFDNYEFDATTSPTQFIIDDINIAPSSLSVLQDTFDDNSINTTIWTTELAANASEVVETSQQLQISHTAASEYNQFTSLNYYNLAGTATITQLVNAGNQALTSHEAILGIFWNETQNDKLWITVSGGNIKLFKRVAGGSNTQVGSNVTYNSSTHNWFRIREASGTLYADYSTDGASWTNLWSIVNWTANTIVRAFLQSGNWQAEASGSFAYFDNFNLPTTNTIQTQSGKSNIAAAGTITTQTQSGKARVTALTTQYQQGKARLTVLTKQFQTGVTRITALAKQIQSGLANIKNTTVKVQAGLTRITALTKQMQSGIANIFNTTLKTQTGKTRITVFVKQFQAGVSRITNSAKHLQQGFVRITALTFQALPGKTRLTALITKLQQGVTRIQITSFGTIGKALQFDGAQNYVSLGTLGNFGSNLGNGFYAKFDIQTWQTAAFQFGEIYVAPAMSVVLHFNADYNGTTSTGKFRLYIRDTGARLLKAGTTNATNFNDGNKHTIEISANVTAGTVTIKLDEAILPVTISATPPATFTNLSNNFLLGALNNGGTPGAFFKGTIDNFVIGTSPTTLYGSYLFDDGANPTADASGNNNNGTLLGNPLPAFVKGLTFLSGIARITANIVRVQGGLIRITNRAIQTILGQTRIQQVIHVFQSGIARFTRLTMQTQGGVAKLLSSITATIQIQQAKARVTILGKQVQQGVAYLTVFLSRIQVGTSSILVTLLATTKIQPAIARLTTLAEQAQAGFSRITRITEKLLQGKVRMTEFSTQTQSGKGIVRTSTGITLAGKTKVNILSVGLQAGKGNILGLLFHQQYGKARIIAAPKEYTQNGQIYIYGGKLQNQILGAVIYGGKLYNRLPENEYS